MRKIIYIFLIFASMMTFLSCERSSAKVTMKDYEAAKADALKNVDLIRDFKKTFPKTYLQYYEGFMHYDGTQGDTQWTASAALYDRYQINMWIPVKLSSNRRKIVSTGDPFITLEEFESIEMSDGRVGLVSYAGSRKFRMNTWEKIKASQGRIEEVFKDIKTNSPVENFNLYVEDRNQRVQKK